ncbi:MAG: YncE family protein [Acidimicrobiales bacterium]
MANVRRVLVSLFVVSAALATIGAAPAAAATVAGGFTAVTPARILDTRLGLGAPPAKVGPGQTINLQITGRGGVPGSGVSAAALNLAVTEPTSEGYLTAWPAGEARPVASNTNFAVGQTVSTAAVVKLGAGGAISLFNSSGSSHVIADVAGWHALNRATGSPFTPVNPTRVFDSRNGQPIGPGGTVTVNAALGMGGVTAVALNVTATEPTATTFLTAFPAGEALPLAANLNVVPGQTRGNFVAVKVTGGAVKIYNNSGSTHVVVDVLGIWSSGSTSRLAARSPVRVLDTRLGLGAAGGPLGPNQTLVLQFPASAVPTGRAVGAVINVAVTGATAGGWLTVYPGDKERPLASNLNFEAGETVPNLVVVPVDDMGRVNIYNSGGNVHVIADVVGWLDPPAYHLEVDGLSTFGGDVVIDPTSTYAYFSNTGKNQVEVLRLADGVLEDPILVGSQPMGLDLTPAGDRLYVALRGSVFVSVVDVAARQELRRFPIPTGSSSDRPYSIAVLANGKALLTTTFDGSGFGARMYQIDLPTDTVSARPDFWLGGSTTEFTTVQASGDRQSAVVVAGDISSGPIFRYDAPTDTFSNEVNTNRFISAIATNQDGSVTLVNSGMVFDDALNLAGTAAGCGATGVAVNAAGTVGYGLGATGPFGEQSLTVAVCDLVRFMVTGSYSLPDDRVGATGRLALSPDGAHLVGITDTGVLHIPL